MPQVAISRWDGTYGTKLLPCNIFFPSTMNLTKAGIAVFHGGGWSGGVSTDPNVISFCQKLAAYGFTAVSYEYTLATPDKTPPVIEEVFNDMAAAFAQISTFTCVAGKPVFGVGFSAGGHLLNTYCSLRATNLPEGIALIGAPNNLATWATNDPLIATFDILLGGHDSTTLAQYSPLQILLNPAIRQLNLLGSNDPFGPAMLFAEYSNKLLTECPNSGSMMYKDAGHSFENKLPQLVAMLAGWFGCCTLP